MFKPDDNFNSGDASGSEPVLPLAQQLRQGRDALQQVQAPTQVLPAVLAAFDQLHRPVALAAAPASLRQRCRAWLAQWVAAGAGGAAMGRRGASLATACLLVLTVGLIVLLQPVIQPSQGDARQTAVTPNQAPANFVSLVPPARMAGTSAAWLVPAELSHANLASLGAPFDPSRANETVHAELLVNARGDVLAVRLP